MANDAIERFLKAEARDLEVPRDSELTVDPEHDRPCGEVHRLELRTFDDLRGLRLILPEVREDEVREAIAADDATAWEQACHLAETGRTGCSCDATRERDDRPVSALGPDRVEAVYRAVRRRRHPALARVVGAEIKNPVEADSLAVRAVYGWTRHLAVAKVIDVVAFKFMDVTILHNATLALAPSVNVFNCGGLRIHVGGRLRINGSYVKVYCASAQGNLP